MTKALLGEDEFEEEVHREKTEKENPKASTEMVKEPETRKPLSAKAAAVEERESNTAPSGVMEIEKLPKTVAATNVLPPRKTEGQRLLARTNYWLP